MARLNLLVARSSHPTGRILQGILEERGHTISSNHAQGVVSYGVHYTGRLPSLNAGAGAHNKLQELQVLRRAKVPVIRVAETPERGPFPLLARRVHHHGGTDIRIANTPRGVRFRLANGWNYFTIMEESDREVRCWVFGDRHLGTYEKVQRHPRRTRRFGRNYANGWAFELLHEGAIPRAAVDVASHAIAALGLDFGAVDILHSPKGWLALEVNTAPGVEGEARQCIQGLAARIDHWAQRL